MRLFYRIGISVLCFCLVLSGRTQTISAKPVKIAVFAPVYIDSAFNNDTYKLGKNNLPKYLLPGLDFYNGVMLAIDSLNAEKAPVEVLFYDSKSSESQIQQLVATPEFADISLIIASFNTRAEIKPLADYALEKNIPIISATYPNDGGLTGNPFFVLINPTLLTHMEGIFKYLHRFYPTNTITLFRKKGNVEDMILTQLNKQNTLTPGTKLKLNSVDLTDSFTVKDITSHLDSTRLNVVICGTLNESFGSNLSKILGSSKNFQTLTIGMPTWDGLKDIGKDIDIVYSTPYNLTRTDKLSAQLSEKYKVKYAGRPSDMVFKGFESMYHFTKLAMKYGNGLINHLSEKEFKLFNEFDIQPVKLKKENPMPDYLENKKLYFIRKVDGRLKSVN